MWKHNPLPFHSDAQLAHVASVAAQQQGKFWEMHDKMFANQAKIKMPDLQQYAKEIGLDIKRFEKDLADPALLKIVEADKREAAAAGATGTPTFYVNGHYMSGAKPFDEFAKAINAELAKLNLPVPPGALGK